MAISTRWSLNGTEYTTLANAVMNTTDGDTITLLQDTTTTGGDYISTTYLSDNSRRITIDLNGHYISSSTSSHMWRFGVGIITITDSVGTGYLESTYSSTSNNRSTIYGLSSTISGETIYPTIILNGIEIRSASTGCYLSLGVFGTATNSTITALYPIRLWGSAGTLAISNSALTSNSTTGSLIYTHTIPSKAITIDGGTYTYTNFLNDDTEGATITITGGRFSTDISQYVDLTLYDVTLVNNMYEVTPKSSGKNVYFNGSQLNNVYFNGSQINHLYFNGNQII